MPWLDLRNSESPQFTGQAVVVLAADPGVMERTGSVVVIAQLARDYGFTDIDRKAPRPLTLEDVQTTENSNSRKTAFCEVILQDCKGSDPSRGSKEQAMNPYRILFYWSCREELGVEK